MVFEPSESKKFIEVALSGRATEPREFKVLLETAQNQAQLASLGGEVGKVVIGRNGSAVVSIIYSLGW